VAGGRGVSESLTPPDDHHFTERKKSGKRKAIVTVSGHGLPERKCIDDIKWAYSQMNTRTKRKRNNNVGKN
jgi:hypothetical protein